MNKNQDMGNKIASLTSRAGGQARCILVVEDNPEMGSFMRMVLERFGYTYLGARNGIEGVAVAKRERPDLILMDLSMPTMDGYEATRLLKAHPQVASIPVLAVTGMARSIDHKHAIEAGCDGYISKPYSLHDLLALIEEFLPHP
ncbi:MAG: response regulator [Anaerolineae bacterium]